VIYHVATRWYPAAVYVHLAWWHDETAWWSVCLGLN